MNKTIKILLVLLILLVSAAVFHWKGKLVVAPTGNIITMCFIRNTEDGGGAKIVMNISGDKVTGKFDWLPAEKDSKTGSFEGKISPVDPMMMARTLDVWWNTSAEGVRITEQLKIIMGEGNAAPGFGEMKDRGDGVYVYAHPENILYEPNLSLAECDE